MRALLFIALVACGGGTAPPRAESGPPAAMIATGAPDDVIVAQVGGRPVWGSCVARQVAATPSKTKQVAADECVQFELLAQAAEQKGLDRHAETIDTTRTALVGRLVDQFADSTSLNATKAKIDEIYKPATFTVPERRESWMLRVPIPEKDPTDADHATARAIATKVYEALKNETGLMPPHFEDAVKRLTTLKAERYKPIPETHDGTMPEYRGALFAIPDVGRVSSVIKTPIGYFVILLSAIAPAVALDRQAAGPIIHANLQRRLFEEFYRDIITNSKTTVKIEPLEQFEKDRP